MEGAAMSKGQPDMQERVEIERAGMVYQGHFVIDGRSMTVTYDQISKSAPLGEMADTPHRLARLLLREIVTGILGRRSAA
jgi:hypothetical protein